MLCGDGAVAGVVDVMAYEHDGDVLPDYFEDDGVAGSGLGVAWDHAGEGRGHLPLWPLCSLDYERTEDRAD